MLARESVPKPGPQARSCRRLYDEAVRQALIVLWEASDRICGKRLKAALPLLIGAMEQHGHLALDPTVKQQLASHQCGHNRPAPVHDARAGVWRAQAPLGGGLSHPAQRADSHLCRLEGSPARLLRGRHGGALRRDQVRHGNFVHSLVLTDIATGWTECVALLVRDQTLIVQGACLGTF